MTRRQAREAAFAIMFEKSFFPEASLESIVELAKASEFFSVNDFALRLAETTAEKMPQIDEKIEPLLVNWSLKRISRVSLAALRIAACEILYFDDIPQSVSINEAVELMKKYSTEQDAAFVNGVLGSLCGSESA